MPSSFSEHYTRPLSVHSTLESFPGDVADGAQAPAKLSTVKRDLEALFSSLGESPSSQVVQGALTSLNQLQSLSGSLDQEEEALRRVIVEKLAIGLYAQSLDVLLKESTEVEIEAEWWQNRSRYRRRIAYYFLQTLPERIVNLVRAIVQDFRRRHIPLHLSNFTPTNLYQLFPSRDVFHPSLLVTSLFPHLKHQRQAISLYSSSLSPFGAMQAEANFFQRLLSKLSHLGSQLASIATLPFELTRQEIRQKRQELEKIRDVRAETLGYIAQMRDNFALVMRDPEGSSDNVESILTSLDEIIGGTPLKTDAYLPSPSHTPGAKPSRDDSVLVSKLAVLSNNSLPGHAKIHTQEIDSQGLRRPGRLTRTWPGLLFFPPLILYGTYALYASTTDVKEFVTEARQTLEGFVKGWLVEPVKDVLRTVRTGGQENVLVSKEGVEADVQSLERMVLSLAKEQLNYSNAQLEPLSRQIRTGDLTPVLKLYEEDIKSPLKSSLTGTLLRTVLIQVQKAKVDLDQALAGIDKLLKSQELTFAFVGFAPAFIIVYSVLSYVRSAWQGGKGKGRYGGTAKRAAAWAAMRRIERILISQPTSSSGSLQTKSPSNSLYGGDAPIYPLTAGLLLLSVARLRAFGEQYLPTGSRLREGFLDDVNDLENPSIGRAEKLRVVERMWRSWGSVMGWTNDLHQHNNNQ